jgi:VWFA-related protein
VAVVSAATLVLAQAPQGITINGIDDLDFPTLRVFATVTDRDGRPVLGLTESDFEALVKGRDAQIVRVEEITNGDLPVSVVLVLDSSESMFGNPLADLKNAANLLLDNLRPVDEVAVINFDSGFEVIQPFTNDFSAARAAVNTLSADGVTALFGATYAGAELAINQASNPRRFVVLVTDGHEFGGRSNRSADEGIRLANDNGIPFFAIGFGSVYIPYLTELGEGTNGRTYILPSSGQLTDAFNFISNFLRSQYIITLAPTLEPDGSPAPITLRSGAASTSRGYVTPDLYPLPSIVGALSEPIAELTSVLVQGEAPRRFGQLNVAVNGNPVSIQNPAVNGENTRIEGIVEIDPLVYAPGDYQLTVEAVDALGGSRSTSQRFTIAELPLIVTATGIRLGEVIDQPSLRTVAAEIAQTQGAISQVAFAVDGTVVAEDADAPYSADIDLDALAPGAHILTITARNVNNQQGVQEIPFTIPQPPTATPTNTRIPPTATFTNTPMPPTATPTNTRIPPTATPTNTRVPPTATFTHTPMPSTRVSASSTPVPAVPTITAAPATSAVIVPSAVPEQPTATRAAPMSTAVPLSVTPVPLVFTTTGVRQGEVVTDAARAVRVTLGEGVQAESAIFTLDGVEIDRDTAAPYITTFRTSQLAPGDHILRVTVTSITGEIGAQEIAFVIPQVQPTATVTPSNVTAPVIPTIVPLTFSVEGIELGEIVSGDTVTVEVTLPDGVEAESVTFDLNDEELSVDTEAPYVQDIDTGALDPGAYILGITVASVDGQTAAENIPFTVAALEASPVPLGFTVAGLVADEVITGAERTVEVTLPEGVVAESVQFDLNGVELSTDTEAPYTLNLDMSALEPGDYVLGITVTGTDGQTATDEIPFTIPAPAQTVPVAFTLTNLADGQTITEAEWTVEAVPAEGVTAESVTFAVDGAEIGTDAEAPFTVTIDTTALSEGEHTLSATMRDTAGAEAAQSVTFNLPARTAQPDLLLIGGSTLLLLLLIAGWTVTQRRRR